MSSYNKYGIFYAGATSSRNQLKGSYLAPVCCCHNSSNERLLSVWVCVPLHVQCCSALQVHALRKGCAADCAYASHTRVRSVPYNSSLPDWTIGPVDNKRNHSLRNDLMGPLAADLAIHVKIRPLPPLCWRERGGWAVQPFGKASQSHYCSCMHDQYEA